MNEKLKIDALPSGRPAPGHKAINLSGRLYSLDALRGFDMLMIMGTDHLFRHLSEITKWPFFEILGEQFEHTTWNGFHFYDMIFPLFLFIVGVATPYSVDSRIRKGMTREKILFHVIKRGLILVLLGIISHKGLKILPLSEIRFGSVLGLIGWAYMFSNIIYLYTKRRGQIIWLCVLLIGYWLLLKFTSAPGFPAGDLTMQGNFTSYIDRTFLPGKLYKGIHEPEGILVNIPATGTALLGILTGLFLKNNGFEPQKKAWLMAVAGVILIALARIWNLDFPVNKNLWTSSFVLQAGGFSLLALALFYFIIDVRGHKKWAFFFKVIGMNSILIYMSDGFLHWSNINNSFFEWLGQLVGEPYNVVALTITSIALQWMFLYFLYRKKIFLKI